MSTDLNGSGTAQLSSALSADVSDAMGGVGVLRLPRTILFGAGQRHAVGQSVAGLGKSALICTDARFAATDQFQTIAASLAAAGVIYHVFSGTEAELPVAGVATCVAEVAGRPIDVIVGVGGGSCIDMAKVVSLVLAHGGQPSDYYGELRVPGPVLPVVAVPTTAGTGSEATPVAVLTDPHRDMKVGISSPHLVPQIAVCDAELTHTCPGSLTASAGADALTHLVESYTAIRRPGTPELPQSRVFIGKSLFTDKIALAGLRFIGRSLIRAYQEPANAAARHDVMAAALAGGVALGTAGTAAAHALQYPLGGLTHTPHGVGVGVLLPYVMRYNFSARIPEFAEIARALAPGESSGDELADAMRAVELVAQIIEGVGLPRTIAEMGLPAAKIEEVAERALLSTRLVENNPRPLDREAMLAITRAAYDGDQEMSLAAPV